MNIPCVGAIVLDADGRLLLIRRGSQPAAGQWSIPGGRVEPGESDLVAVRREVREETGLEVAVGPLAGRVVRAGLSGGPGYAIADYRCTVIGGTLRAGDDAAEAGWFTTAELGSLPVTDGLVDALRSWEII